MFFYILHDVQVTLHNVHLFALWLEFPHSKHFPFKLLKELNFDYCKTNKTVWMLMLDGALISLLPLRKTFANSFFLELL